MDRNSVIGLVLIALLLLVYLNWFRPQAPIQAPPPVATDSTRTPVEEKVIPVEEPDSLLAATYGDAASLFKGEESPFTIKTQDLTIGFTNKGGIINYLKLEHYKTYHKDPSQRKPIILIDRSSTQFHLLSSLKGEKVDLYTWYYQAEQQKKNDTTVVTFTAQLPTGAGLTQTYYIPEKGYEIRYTITSSGLENQLASDNLSFQWHNVIHNTEKDIQDTRNNTTITYYSEDDGGFDELNQRSTDTEKESFTRPVEWVSIKQKYFLTSIISKNNFAAGDIELIPVDSDTIVKKAVVNLLISKKDLTAGKAEFKYYIGPNDYQLIGKVAEKFSKNVYLGWPPVYWVNKFIIFPVFHFLTLFIGNFGVIITILVILLKLVLAPLSYRSYLSMAKMKVLKPELDEIKEKHGSDMTKIQQEQMKLYQQVGVNPLSGCIPVLMQMPILFAMFYLFPASIELRQQPFLWAEDLSTYDSIVQFPFTIPLLGSIMGNHISLFTLLMTVSTLIYTWQNNQISSVQGPMKSMSYIMPLIFFFVLNSFSAGLTFYYFVSNLVTFAQQAIIRRFVDDDKIKRALEENRKRIASGGGGKKSKFMTKLEEAMKASEEARKNAQENRKRKKN